MLFRGFPVHAHSHACTYTLTYVNTHTFKHTHSHTFVSLLSHWTIPPDMDKHSHTRTHQHTQMPERQRRFILTPWRLFPCVHHSHCLFAVASFFLRIFLHGNCFLWLGRWWSTNVKKTIFGKRFSSPGFFVWNLMALLAIEIALVYWKKYKTELFYPRRVLVVDSWTLNFLFFLQKELDRKWQIFSAIFFEQLNCNELLVMLVRISR